MSATTRSWWMPLLTRLLLLRRRMSSPHSNLSHNPGFPGFPIPPHPTHCQSQSLLSHELLLRLANLCLELLLQNPGNIYVQFLECEPPQRENKYYVALYVIILPIPHCVENHRVVSSRMLGCSTATAQVFLTTNE
ncbi:hypothetical protein Pelo_7264 [Pelomyxa schiedti]|nr:hypothetical protein Pelo_7264 [Pelomyxa schiedti]